MVGWECHHGMWGYDVIVCGDMMSWYVRSGPWYLGVWCHGMWGVTSWCIGCGIMTWQDA